MKWKLKSCLNIFFFTGLSVKVFNRKSSFFNIFLSIWSFVVVILLMALAIAISVVKPFKRDGEIRFLSLFTLYLVTINLIVILLSSLFFRKKEQKFWEIFDLTENIFEIKFKVDLHESHFAKRCLIKIFLELCVSVLLNSLFLSSLTKNNENRLLTSILSMVLTKIIRIFVIKFIFYVDVLNFCLNQINAKLSNEEVSINEIIILKRTFTLCWRMCHEINEIFGWGLLFTSPLIVMGALFSFHNLTIDIANSELNYDPVYVMISIAIQAFLVSTSCDKSSRISSSIASKILQQSCKEKHEIIESFALQILHQKFIFTAKGVGRFNHAAMIRVS